MLFNDSSTEIVRKNVVFDETRVSRVDKSERPSDIRFIATLRDSFDETF